MLVTFLALFIWVLNPKNRKRFDDAADLPFQDEDIDERTRKTDKDVE